VLGIATDSLDSDGKVTDINTKIENNNDIQKKLDEIIPEFIGEIQQVPPMFSAKKKDGQRLYKLARKGIVVERQPNTVTIYSIERQPILNFYKPIIHMKIKCSTGTYIRTLVSDMAEKLGYSGYASEIIRTKIGNIGITEAIKGEALSLESIKSRLFYDINPGDKH